MRWHDDEDEAPPGRLRELLAWLGCLMAAGMPTVVLASIWQGLDRAT